GERAHGPRIRRGKTRTKWRRAWSRAGEPCLERTSFYGWRVSFPAPLACRHPLEPSPGLHRVGTIGRWVLRVTREGDPMIWTILALACIVLGFVGELIDERILLGTLEWFVAAIAFTPLD